MISFDMRTIIVSFILTYIVSTIVIFILWVQYHNRYRGTTHLFISYLFQTSGLFLLTLRVTVPDSISIVLANTLLITGTVICYMGLEAYTGRRTNQFHNYILLILFTFVHIWFTIFDPDLTIRNFNVSIASFLVFFQCSWLMLYRVSRKEIRLTHPVGFVFVAFCVVCLANILMFALGGKEMPVDYFDAGSFDSAVVMAYHMLVILLTYSLVLLYGNNLLHDIKEEEEKLAHSSSEKIAEQNKYNEIINHERNLLRAMIDNLPDPVAVKDNEGRFLLINKAYLEVIGADSQEEAVGKSLFDYLPEDEAELSSEDDKKVMHSGRKIIDKVESFSHVETGFNYSYLTSKIPVFDSEGVPVQLVTISHDITARKKAEDSLKESAEFNRSLLRTIPFGMDIVDEDGTILFQSDNFRKLVGSGATGKKCWEVYRDDKIQCTDCPLKRGIEIGKTEKYESKGVLGDRVFDIYHTGMNYQGRKAMLEIFHDITDQKHSEDELIKSKEMAEESNRLKTAFLHNISHEIRTPMNAIVGFTALIGEPDISPENHRSYLDIITQSSNHLLSIVTDIIEISNIEAGMMKVNMSEVNVNSVLENLYRQYSLPAKTKGLEFVFEQSGSGNEDYLLTDNTKLIQVLTNLIGNAFKFTEEGYIRFGYKRYDDNVEFFVSDSGIGIQEEQQTRVFERFYQVDSSENRQYEGTGLGLSLSKTYVEIMGGKIWVRSEVGKGSTFFVSLPC